ncbi:hypothetical protein FHS81_003227 [Pseudochelatococcus contaminans]|uniref:Uncharacterized protein n=1 Tax=Pseudochelatococcus contaminans TaxID=1538103 RepID=A0A7W6EIG3_9HYPH|nr:hypothetical protein [Pseudochelatococcus contaminans]
MVRTAKSAPYLGNVGSKLSEGRGPNARARSEETDLRRAFVQSERPTGNAGIRRQNIGG